MKFRYFLACLTEPFYRLYFWLMWRHCELHGHKWGKGGTSFDGEYTSHWAQCRRCGFSDSD